MGACKQRSHNSLLELKQNGLGINKGGLFHPVRVSKKISDAPCVISNFPSNFLSPLWTPIGNHEKKVLTFNFVKLSA